MNHVFFNLVPRYTDLELETTVYNFVQLLELEQFCQ